MLLKPKNTTSFYLPFFLVISMLLLPVSVLAQQQVSVSRTSTLMGSLFNFTIIAKDSASANLHINQAIAEIERIENLISEWKSETQISKVNQNAGIQPVKVDKEVFELTKRALDYSKLTDGAFDISIAAMDKIWKFDGSMTIKPTTEQISHSVRKVSYQNIILDHSQSTIFLKEKGMKIGFGSIGKGYAADKARDLLKNSGVKSGLVDASGDISTWGQPEQGKPWTVGIRNPFKRQNVAKIIRLTEAAVATSGSYEKYAEIEGIRYSHIINPKTGIPASGLTSVSVYGPSCEFANALSTSVMVLGKAKGKQLLKRFPVYHYFMITDQGKLIQ